MAGLVIRRDPQQSLSASRLPIEDRERAENAFDIEPRHHHGGFLDTFGALVDVPQGQRREVKDSAFLGDRAAVRQNSARLALQLHIV